MGKEEGKGREVNKDEKETKDTKTGKRKNKEGVEEPAKKNGTWEINNNVRKIK